MPVKRPNPEHLLKRIKEEERHGERGKLKIYLGAAPGVGKTYEMLHDALQVRQKGLDVVIGLVESHGRKEIDDFRQYFETLPKQKINYHNKQLEEFDLDGALARNPGLILIDEMAHTNVKGLRHEKRWQDIKELLDRGIDVYTTLNVQHIESLIDDVSQIIHAPIRETVPDFMIELADVIELVDIPPEELLQRLEEGKVYFPEQAHLAKEHFFRKGNLGALRELALRTTAERVGKEVLLYRQGQGIQHIWPSKEKILVCIGPGLESVKLIRAAKRIAASLQVDWIAVYVETPKLQASVSNRNSAIVNLRLAAQLGADTRVLSGFDVVRVILHFAHEQNVTLIMLWKNIRTRIQEIFFSDLADEMVRHSGEIDVYIMTGHRDEKAFVSTVPEVKPVSYGAYIASLLMVLITTVINYFVFPYLSSSNLIMIYVLGVTLIALYGNFGASILGAMLSVLCYDFFFVPPYYSFGITDLQYFFTLLVMLLVTLIISHLTILTRRVAESASLVQHQTVALHTLSRKLAGEKDIGNLLRTSVSYLADTFNSDIVVFLPENGHLRVRAGNTEHGKLDEKESSVAQWVFELGQPAGMGTNTLSSSSFIYLPLQTAKGTIGVLQICPHDKTHLLTPEEMHLLEECAIEIALSLERDYSI